jgi:hypothetical protein
MILYEPSYVWGSSRYESFQKVVINEHNNILCLIVIIFRMVQVTSKIPDKNEVNIAVKVRERF